MDKAARITFRLRLGEREALERLALRNERSVGGEIRRAIQRYVRDEQARGEDGRR